MWGFPGVDTLSAKARDFFHDCCFRTWVNYIIAMFLRRDREILCHYEERVTLVPRVRLGVLY